MATIIKGVNTGPEAWWERILIRTNSAEYANRILAWIRRPLRRKIQQRSTQERPVDNGKGPLRPQEITEAEAAFIMLTQTAGFAAELRDIRSGRPIPKESNLARISPFIDDAGLLRAGGRLGNGPFEYSTRHPLILPNSRYSTVLMWSAHSAVLHAGAERTLAEFQHRYWTSSARRLARKLVHQCPVCWSRTRKPSNPPMAPLPAARLSYGRPPFTGTGVDYFGPLQVTVKRSTAKRWGCLFTFLATRAVHIEIAHSLDVHAFVSALRRFIARRGKPKVIYSDNGTNLVAGEKELRMAIESWNGNQIAEESTRLGIDWRFSPPAGPHFGGVWERPVQSAKRALYAVMKDRTTTDETLLTLMSEVEAFLNARPLRHISVDPADPEPITPNHFLLGRAAPHIPPDIFVEGEIATRRSWRTAQQLAEDVWRRWLREYVPRLIPREKWTQPVPPVKNNDVALIAEEAAPRGRWTMCRIVQTIAGKDGVIRQADVRLPTGKILRRQVVKLVILESENPAEGNAARYDADRAGDVADQTDRED